MTATPSPLTETDSAHLDRWMLALACGVVAAGSVAVLMALVGVALDTSDLLVGAILLLAAVIGTRFEQEHGSLSIGSDLVASIVAAVVVPPLAPFVGASMGAGRYPSWQGRVANGSMGVTSASVAAIAASLAAPPSGTSTVAQLSIATCAAMLTYSIVNTIHVAALVRAVSTESMLTSAATIAQSMLAATLFGGPIVLLIVWLAQVAGLGAVALVMAPMVLVQYFLHLYHRKAQLTDELAEKARLLARTNLQFAAAMVKALDARDAYTAGHSAAVAVYTRDIARDMGFDEETVRMAHLAGLLHDIGKIGVPGRVLNKTSPLDDVEFELMKSHAAMGAEILGEVDLYADIAILVRYHHERIDGAGYPSGIAGDAIPAISRMIAVADTYSAMTTDRPYRPGMPTEQAMQVLRDCRGTQLDTEFTNTFLQILVVADDAYRRGYQTDFEVEVARHEALSSLEIDGILPNEPVASAAPEPTVAASLNGEVVAIELAREAA